MKTNKETNLSGKSKVGIKQTKSLVFATAIAASIVLGVGAATSEIVLRHTITGEVLDLSHSPEEGRDTPAVKKFLETGLNPYLEVKACLPKGEEAFLVACSGCHGHYAEGKVGVGLNDSYWTYPKNKTDKGLFETIYGGAQGMMGPHGSHLEIDEILLLMAWIRHLYTGDVSEADWLTADQKKAFTPFDPKASEHSGNKGAEEKAKAETSACTVSPS